MCKMIGYLIKNNFKIMFRSAVNILLYVLCPIVVSAVLISAFSSLMESYKAAPDFTVGYRMQSGSEYAGYMSRLAGIAEENGITFAEYDKGDVETLIREHSLGGFVEFTKDGYKIYETGDAKVEGAALECLISTFFNSAISMHTEDVSIKTEKPGFAPAINSTDYYGIIYVVYFGWCAIVCAAGLFAHEKKYRISERLEVSNLSTLQIYLARLIPIATVVSLGTGAAAVISAVTLGVHWGNIALSALIVLLMIVAATAFEMMIYQITNSLVATIVISFGIVWIMGFIGGSFETYMFSSHPESLKLISPIYHGNRALAELSSMGRSDFAVSSIVYSTVLALVSSVISVTVGTLKRRAR